MHNHKIDCVGLAIVEDSPDIKSSGRAMCTRSSQTREEHLVQKYLEDYAVKHSFVEHYPCSLLWRAFHDIMHGETSISQYMEIHSHHNT